MSLSEFGIGALHFGSFLDFATCRQIVHKALDSQVCFFDTSPLYGNGYSEQILGDILSELKQPVFISTKVGLQIAQRKDGKFGVEVSKLSKTHLKHSVEQSLKKLKRERIELLMLHAFDAQTPLSETVDGLMELHTEGKIQYFGCSNYNPSQLQALLKEVIRKQCPFFFASQCHYNLIERRAASKFIPICEKNNLRLIVNRALARGALSGQYKWYGVYPENSRAAKSWRVQKWLTVNRLDLLEKITRAVQKKGADLSTVALLWLKKRHPSSIPLIGVKNLEQLESSLAATQGILDSYLFEELETIISKEPNVYKSPPRYFEK